MPPKLEDGWTRRFDAWVYNPATGQSQWRGFNNAYMWIRRNQVLIGSKRFFGRPLMKFDQVEYAWPTAVVEVIKPGFGVGPALLYDIDGQLSKACVSRPMRLRNALFMAGFDVLEVTRWGWGEVPRPVPRDLLGQRADRVPPCVVDRIGDPRRRPVVTWAADPSRDDDSTPEA